ncbi:hypothetical protein BV20DRAFT_971788 [Pilatotrama ljubarskyi]|nr:hypothetical protein BV20DRAFT_971788 [Pilatotrama ljubarskyi]
MGMIGTLPADSTTSPHSRLDRHPAAVTDVGMAEGAATEDVGAGSVMVVPALVRVATARIEDAARTIAASCCGGS